MKPSTLQRTIVDAQRRFWSLKRAAARALRGDLGGAAHIAARRYVFLGVEKNQLDYAHYLEGIEQGYYGPDERLLLDQLARREPDDIAKRAAAAGVVQLDTLHPSARVSGSANHHH
jgi:hypothetical protein